MKKNRTKLLIISICIFLSCITLGIGVLALFTDYKKENVNGQVGDVHVQLVEDFPTTDEYGTTGTTKTFSGLSLGSKRTYIRASIFTTVEYKVGTIWNTYAVPQQDILYTISPMTLTTWIDGSDGYWYYNQIVNRNDSTTDFIITGVQLASMPEELIGKDVRYKMTVRLEGAQATHDAYKDVFNITALPAGVQTPPTE